MATFTPVNSLEIRLRAVLTDRNTPSWSFYTPLAATQLWIIVRDHPELDGSERIVPGYNPEVCVCRMPEYSYIGVYTAACRAQEAIAKIKKWPWPVTFVSAPGYQLLKFLSTFDDVDHLWINAGLKECQYHLDFDMVELLLARPEPTPERASPQKVVFNPPGDPAQYLAPLREFLSGQPKVRAAWIFGQKREPPLPAGAYAYDLNLLMDDPEDKSLLQQVKVMAKALTPVEMEWASGVMIADEQSLRNLAKKTQPFFARPDFLKT